MTLRSRLILRSARTFAICVTPVAVVLGLFIWSMGQTYGGGVDVVEVLVTVGGYLLLATLAYGLTVNTLEEEPCHTLEGSSWKLPVLCGVLFSGLTCAGLIENTSDVAALFIGHRFDDVVSMVATVVWSGVSTWVGFCVARAWWSTGERVESSDGANRFPFLDAMKIVALSVVAAIIYGVVHDQVTVRICLEYFTIGHPRIFDTESPTLLALGWGVVATWWVGLIIGFVLSVAALAGSRPRRTARSLVRDVLVLLAWMGVFAIAAGFVAHFAATKEWIQMIGRVAIEVPDDRHVAFLTALWMHITSYLVGFLGGLFLVRRVWRSRER